MSSNQGTQQTGTKAFDSSIKEATNEQIKSSNIKTKKILRKIAKAPMPIKKYAWLAGHGLTLTCGSIYIVMYFLQFFRLISRTWYWIPLILYSFAFIGVIVSYTVTILTTFGKVTPSYHTLLATLNFQSLVLACIWLITRKSAFKLIPYFLIAGLQMSDMFQVKVVLRHEAIVSEIIAFAELFIFVTLTVDTLLFRGTSGFALVIYAAFYWIRLNFSPYTQAYILQKLTLIDAKIMKNQKPAVQEKWKKFLQFVKYRRQVMAETLAKKLDHEVEIEPTVKDEIKNKPLGDQTENYQIKGQSRTSPNELSKGVIVPTEYEIETKRKQKEKELEAKDQKLNGAKVQDKVEVTEEDSKDKLAQIKQKAEADIDKSQGA
ncbi:hypothetical protein WICPIJ_006749 [Wickerhamomyces pijperi]|uniref:Transmembrane protein n=1 Tax=Wickerhamomyces pijperi TaxID=599730 RepID=A0A9P8TKQ5_WICPI|nr:hypothetical protein WICPIJ_006749 [Wickerhamomyces pijperi]